MQLATRPPAFSPLLGVYDARVPREKSMSFQRCHRTIGNPRPGGRPARHRRNAEVGVRDAGGQGKDRRRLRHDHGPRRRGRRASGDCGRQANGRATGRQADHGRRASPGRIPIWPRCCRRRSNEQNSGALTRSRLCASALTTCHCSLCLSRQTDDKLAPLPGSLATLTWPPCSGDDAPAFGQAHAQAAAGLPAREEGIEKWRRTSGLMPGPLSRDHDLRPTMLGAISRHRRQAQRAAMFDWPPDRAACRALSHTARSATPTARGRLPISSCVGRRFELQAHADARRPAAASSRDQFGQQTAESARLEARGSGGRAKSIKSAIISCTRWACARISASSRRRSGSASSRASNCARPAITASGLLISCPAPAANSASDASFSACELLWKASFEQSSSRAAIPRRAQIRASAAASQQPHGGRDMPRKSAGNRPAALNAAAARDPLDHQSPSASRPFPCPADGTSARQAFRPRTACAGNRWRRPPSGPRSCLLRPCPKCR